MGVFTGIGEYDLAYDKRRKIVIFRPVYGHNFNFFNFHNQRQFLVAVLPAGLWAGLLTVNFEENFVEGFTQHPSAFKFTTILHMYHKPWECLFWRNPSQQNKHEWRAVVWHELNQTEAVKTRRDIKITSIIQAIVHTVMKKVSEMIYFSFLVPDISSVLVLVQYN